MRRLALQGLQFLAQRVAGIAELLGCKQLQMAPEVQGGRARARLEGSVWDALPCRREILHSSLGQNPSFLQRRSGIHTTAAAVNGKFYEDGQRSLGVFALQESISSEDEHQVEDEEEDGQGSLGVWDLQESISSEDEREVADENQDGDEGGSLPEEKQVVERKGMEEKIQFLRELGLRESSLKKLVHLSTQPQRLPLVLRTSVKKLTQVATFLTEEVGLTKEQAAKCLFMNVGSCSLDECLRPKVEYFQQLGISKEQLRKVVCLRPLALKPTKSRIDDIVRFIQGLGSMDAHKIIKSHPQILCLSLEGSMVPTIKFFKDELELNEMQLARVIKWPNIFTFSVDNNLRLKSQYFLSLGLAKKDIASMISASPTVFALNMESSIKPKIDYLLKVLKKDISELVSFPGYLTYSLSGRIQRRHEYAIAAGSDFYSLSYFLICSDEKFRKRCASRALKLHGTKASKPNFNK